MESITHIFPYSIHNSSVRSSTLQLAPSAALFCFCKHFLSKMFSTEMRWPVDESENLAGCWTVLRFLLFIVPSRCAEEPSVFYRNQNDNTVIWSSHAWQYLAAIVKPFHWCCVVFIYLFIFVTSVLACRCHGKRTLHKLRAVSPVHLLFPFPHNDAIPQIHDVSVWQIGRRLRATWK